jgi:hypothetical protein
MVALIAAVALSVGFAAGWVPPGRPAQNGDVDAFEVALLSPGAEPRRVLRYRPAPGRVETMVVAVDTTESKRLGEAEPTEVSHPRLSFRLRLEVTDVAQEGDISFAWRCEEMSLVPVEGTPPPVQEGMRKLAKGIEGRSGSGRMSARGIHRNTSYDTPRPETLYARLVFDSIAEIVEQIATPLPEEPVGIGARWEVSYARNREGVRFTQTVTFELESLDESEARLRAYVAVAGLNQDFEHPEVPTGAEARLKSGHGTGEGELVIGFDRLGDRMVRLTVEIRMEFSVTIGEEEMAVSQVRNIRYESDLE